MGFVLLLLVVRFDMLLELAKLLVLPLVLLLLTDFEFSSTTNLLRGCANWSNRVMLTARLGVLFTSLTPVLLLSLLIRLVDEAKILSLGIAGVSSV
jgi:hypothetical protein